MTSIFGAAQVIKFFRKYRLRSMSQGKTMKYLRYALGEIALVVIGILIALQINNWNLERLDRRQEVKILQQLQADLSQNNAEIASILQFNTKRMRSCDSIMAYWQERRPVDDSLRYHFEQINSMTLFNSAQTTYEYINSQGTNFLNNDSLRDKIILMYEKEFANIFTRQNLSRRTLEIQLIPAYNRQLKSSASLVELGDFAINSPIHPDQLWNDHAFMNAVTQLRRSTQIRMKYLPVTLERLDGLRAEIDAEIERLSSE